MLTHKGLITSVAQQVDGENPNLYFHEEDVILCVLPLFHIYALNSIMLCGLRAGAAILIVPKYEIGALLGLIEKHRVSIMPVVPLVMLAIAKSPDLDKHDLSSVRMLKSGGAPLGKELEDTVRAKFPQAKLGQLPGRTDNEIKNYWNTRIKRRQRAGLPLYPPEVSLQALQERQQALHINGIDGGDNGHHDLLSNNSCEIPDVVFDSLKPNHGIPYVPELPDIARGNMLISGLGCAQYGNFMSPVIHPPKRLRESANLLPGYSVSVKNEYPIFDQFHDDTDRVAYSFGFPFSFDHDSTAKDSQSFGDTQGCHTLSNGNFSTSKPTSEAVKLELPSLQYPETDLGSWGTSCSPTPLLQSVDTFIQSPPTVTLESNCPSLRNSGLLDALLHEAKTLNSSKNNYSDKSSNSSTASLGDIADSSAMNIDETEWDDYGDPLSPLGHSATSFFNESTPISVSGSSLDEQPSTENVIAHNMKSEPADHSWTTDTERETSNSNRLDMTCPDALLASDWLGQTSGYVKDQAITFDTIASLLGEDLSNDYKQIAAGTFTSSQGWGLGSCAWNNMPAVCQLSEFP